MPKKLYQVPVLKSGWTIWQCPIMNGYIMGCCDFGLRHKMKFEIIKIKHKKGNIFEIKKIFKDKNIRIRMKAKRANKLR